MVNPSTESILNQMTNLAMDIAMDYVLPASPMSDVCKSDLQEFEREVYAAVSGCGAAIGGGSAATGASPAGGLLSSLVAGTAGTAGGCCGRPPTDLCKKNSYMGAAGCDSCDACLARRAAAAGERLSPGSSGYSTGSSSSSRYGSSSSSWSSSSSTSSSSSSPSMLSPAGGPCTPMPTPPQQQTAETTMDISWCQFDGCEFDTADNSYLDICDWIFYADRYALTDENREKVQKAFQMVPPGEVTGYVAQPAAATVPAVKKETTAAASRPKIGGTAMTGAGGVTIKCEPDDDYLWTSDHHLQPIILKAEPDADILQITELDHSYLQTGTGGGGSASSSTAVSPAKHHLTSHNHLVDMLGLVTPPPSRSQSSEEEEIDVVNDSWDTPDTPRKGATMADIMKRGIVKKREPPVTKWKNTVKRKHHQHNNNNNNNNKTAAYPMPPPPPKKACAGGLSLLDRFKKDAARHVVVKPEPVEVKQEPVDEDEDEEDETSTAALLRAASSAAAASAAEDERLLRATVKADLLRDEEDDDDDDDEEYDMDADFESLMKNEPDDMFDDEYDDYDDDNDVDWDKVMRGDASADASSSSAAGGRGHKSGASSSCSSGGGRGSGGNCSSSSSSSSSSAQERVGPGRKKKKKKTKTKAKATKNSNNNNNHHHHHHNHHHSAGSSSGKKIKYEGGGQYSYKTKLMDPVKRALHNDLEKSRRVETSMLFMNLSMQVSFLDDNRKIPSKLSILRGAKRECDLMMLDERRLLSEKHVMQQKQRMLRERLFELRREQYHRRYGKSNGNGSSKQLNQH